MQHILFEGVCRSLMTQGASAGQQRCGRDNQMLVALGRRLFRCGTVINTPLAVFFPCMRKPRLRDLVQNIRARTMFFFVVNHYARVSRPPRAGRPGHHMKNAPVIFSANYRG